MQTNAAKVVVVVPIYKLQLTDTEERVLRHSLQVLHQHDACFVAPTQLALDWYRKAFPRCSFLACPDEYFTSPQAYSKLMLGPGFYQYFAKYTHLLVLQTDAVVLRDDLQRWATSPYDYIGAPWPQPYAITLPDVGNAFSHQTFQITVGNGGLSLRRISACIQAIQDCGWVLQKTPMDEDLFFALAGKMSQRFLVPNRVTAAAFALEANPRMYSAMAGTPAMGGHAWEKWDKAYWLEQFAHHGLVLQGDAPAAPSASVSASVSASAPEHAPPPALAPAHNEDALIDQGLKFQMAGDLVRAEQCFQQVLAANPMSWKALYSLFVIEHKRGHQELALGYVDKAIAAEASVALLHHGRGAVLEALERYDESVASYSTAIALKPDFQEALIDKGALLGRRGQRPEALAMYEQLLRVNPDNKLGLANGGGLLAQLSRNDEAAQLFARLVKLDPHYKYADGLLAYARYRTCDWTEYGKQKKRIVEGVRKGLPLCNPLAFKCLSDSAQEQFECAKIFANDMYPTAPQALWAGEQYAHTKLRIAYVSPDFREHPVAHLMAGVLEQHDKTRFQTMGIVIGSANSGPLNARILKSFDEVYDVRGKSSRSVAELLRSLEVDIAVDLAGYTDASRADIFSWRPAPVQINFLGYPGTMGSTYYDYIVADKHVIPPESFAYYTEKVIHLPGSYLPSDDSLTISAEGMTRQDAGLPAHGFVFCCFNHEYKITPDMFDVWMRLLKKVEGSVLWLMKISPVAAANLAKEARKRGVDPARLVFAERIARIEDHLARYRLADLFLDTTPYNAHSTASDVLRAGLPLITCTGSSFASRVASSILHTIGLPELVKTSLQAYEADALAYAQKPALLAAVRDKLRLLNQQERLGTQQFCRDLEAAFVQCAGAPAHTSTPALTLTPAPSRSEDALIDEALAIQESGNLPLAQQRFQQVLAVYPSSWKAQYSLFVLALKAGQLDAALAHIDAAIALQPTSAILHFGRGRLLRSMEQWDASLASYDQAIALQPDYPEAFVNRGALLAGQDRIADALDCYAQLLTLHPNDPRGLGNRGALLTRLGRNEEAIPLFEKLVKVDPQYRYAEGMLAHARARTCDWTDFAKQQKRMAEGVAKGLRVCNPLAFMSLSDSAQEHYQCATIFSNDMFPTAPRQLWAGEAYGHQKLRIGYVSPDFREHPVAHLMAGVLEQHDKTRFETIGFALGDADGSPLNARIVASFDQFFDMRGKSSLHIAELIRSLEVDIAVDLAGYTDAARSDVFAWRPAPVQVNYLGYPGTMGSPHMDYIIADRHVIPQESVPYYTEKVVYLPGTYLPSDDSLTIPTTGITRQMAGLPEQGFVFCCFNHQYKINPDIFDVWMRLLKSVNGSVLWLMKLDATAAANLAKEAKKRGVDPTRLVFAERVPRVEDHLARYQLADLFLDTTPYNAHSTASDVLRAGLPLVTCTGSSFASRVASSILHTIGVPELSTSSLAAYEAAALMYARKPEQLTAVREKLSLLNAQERLSTKQFCRDLEAAYLQCAQPALRVNL